MAMPAKSSNNNTAGMDDQRRKSWKIGSKVEIFSDSKQKWIKGEITKIINDEEGEWLVVQYATFNLKEIQRFNKYIRPILKPNEHTNIAQTSLTSLTSEFKSQTLDYIQNINQYKKSLKVSWQKLSETKNEAGLAIYNAIVFDTKIKTDMTTKPKAISMVFQNTDLKQQSLRFMDMLNTIISALDSPQILKQKLCVLSKGQLFRKFDHSHYKAFKRGFMKGIKRTLSDIWNMDYDNAWEWFWDFMISIMSNPESSNINSDSEGNVEPKIEPFVKKATESDS